jgi:hypothetical protein
MLSLASADARASGSATITPDGGALTHGLAAQYAWVAYLSARYQHSGQGIGISYEVSLPQGLGLAAGARGLWGPRVAADVAFEAFVGASLVPEFGVWRPRIGLELGYSGLVMDERPPDVIEPPGIDQDYRSATSPIYSSIVAAPLRVRVWGLDIATLELAAGTTIADFGRAMRLTIMIGQLTWNI